MNLRACVCVRVYVCVWVGVCVWGKERDAGALRQAVTLTSSRRRGSECLRVCVNEEPGVIV